eukprot:CAMPEP_0179115566 /NCGR_PEP_ID=MMETSP0796-20121207/54166_1 /TAXON_ID=73915 /ORGANISM="Pyrodinium bahamense, Strain pbaha01" /LENGTH=47 /DNA_ID= /DNA_START= /DNA_END= /DNA_ORIENTATION=
MSCQNGHSARQDKELPDEELYNATGLRPASYGDLARRVIRPGKRLDL